MIRIGEQAFFEVLSSDDLWKEFKKYMYPNKKTSNFYDYKDGDLAMKHNYHGLLHESNNLLFTRRSATYSTITGSLQLVKFLYYNRGVKFGNDQISMAVFYGYLDIIVFINEFIKDLMEDVPVPIVICYLNSIKAIKTDVYVTLNVTSSTTRIDLAARNGHLDIIKYLYFEMDETCTEYAINFSVQNGYLDIVKFLLHWNG